MPSIQLHQDRHVLAAEKQWLPYLSWLPLLVVAAGLAGWFGGHPVWDWRHLTRPVVSVLTSAAIYVILLVLFRVVGKRALADITTFDVVLLLIISEATQQAMIGDDTSIANAVLAVCSLASIDVTLSRVKHRFPRLEAWLEGQPVELVVDGRLVQETLDRERMDEEDVLESARATGVATIEEIRLAVLERTGKISIIPFRS